jgi:hypothetical protein
MKLDRPLLEFSVDWRPAATMGGSAVNAIALIRLERRYGRR